MFLLKYMRGGGLSPLLNRRVFTGSAYVPLHVVGLNCNGTGRPMTVISLRSKRADVSEVVYDDSTEGDDADRTI